MATLTNKRPRSDSDGDEIDTSTIFRTQENFAKFLIMESKNPEKNNNVTVSFCHRKANRSPYWNTKISEKDEKSNVTDRNNSKDSN